MKRLMIPAAVLLTALILTGGFFLPTIVLQYRDRQTIGGLTVTDGSGVSYETHSVLKTTDRLKMLTSAEGIGLDNGKNMDADKAYQAALTELGKLAGKGIIEIDNESCRLVKYDVVFLIDSADPSKNMIAWSLYIEDETHMIGAAIDDETGLLLALDYYLNERAYKKGMTIIAPSAVPREPTPELEPGTEGVSVLELIGRTLADYYGLTLIGSEQKKSDYYAHFSFELSDGEDSVVLTVTWTYAGFTVNF